MNRITIFLALVLVSISGHAFELTPSLLDRLEAFDALTSQELIATACTEVVAGIRSDSIDLVQPIAEVPPMEGDQLLLLVKERNAALENIVRANRVFDLKCR
jgi:hypothetical protein